MRVTPAMFVGLAALTALSVQAAPNKANWVDLGAAPPLALVARSCGYDWLRTRSRDHWVIGMGATASPMQMTMIARTWFGIRPKVGLPCRISCPA